MLVFTDGGCTGNGKPNAKASYAVVIGDKVISGLVMPYEYTYINELSTTLVEAKPSNNRGELLSLIHAFIEIIQRNDDEEYIVYSDSKICVSTINSWYYNRLKKNTVHEFKNLDLITIMMSLYEKIKKIKVIHIRGHQKITKDTSEEDKKIINGNCMVDHYASIIL